MDRATSTNRARSARADPRRDGAAPTASSRTGFAASRTGSATLGVQRGDRVGWLGANHPAFLEVLFATAKLGAVMAPVNHRLDHAVIGEVLVGILAHGRGRGADGGRRLAAAGRGVPCGRRSARRARTSTTSTSSRESPDDPVDEVVGLDDVCMLPHTSGTTGTPKGVMLTHGNITWNVVNFLSVVDFRSDDVTIAIAPFFRTGGTGVNVLPVLFTGGTVVVPETPDPDEILRLIEEQRVTIGFGNPDLLEALTQVAAAGRPPTSRASAATSPAARPSRSASSGHTCNEASRSSRGTGSPRPRRSCCSSIAAERAPQGRVRRQAAAVRRHPDRPTRRHRLCTERDGRAPRERPQRDGRLLGPPRRHPRRDR